MEKHWITKRLEELKKLGSNKKPAGLAKALGKDQSFVSKITGKQGRNIQPKEIPIIAAYLEMSIEDVALRTAGSKDSLPTDRHSYVPQKTPEPASQRSQPQSNVDFNSIRTDGLVGENDLPIYASAQGGETGMLITFDPIEHVKRPAPLIGVKKGFGMYVIGDSMAPVFRQGDTILIHPGKPVGRDDEVLIVFSDGNGEHEAMVKTLLSKDDERLHLKQYNPAEEFEIPMKNVFAVYLIVGSYRRR